MDTPEAPTNAPADVLDDAWYADDDVEDPSSLERWQRIHLHFATIDDRHAFAELIGQRLDDATGAIWFPTPTIEEAATLPPFASSHAGARVRPEEVSALFDVERDWQPMWRGMPTYSSPEMRPLQSIDVHVRTMADRLKLRTLAGFTFDVEPGSEVTSAWFPNRRQQRATTTWASSDVARRNPQYPVYVPTKGRWLTAHTIRALERMHVPYKAVVQPQEVERYRAIVATGELLVLPEGLDGLVPTRNWIFEHAVASGAARHWQLDDNISYFVRLTNSTKTRVDDGTIFRCMEDFADRYDNVAIVGPQYHGFAQAAAVLPPFIVNTRVYSCSLINNAMPFRYRDVYNDDTDICLRALKDGWCIVQFYAFLQHKLATMTVKGGNTSIYQGEGRRLMAESLQRQHPDVVTIVEKWGRVQHLVDYRRFRKNEFKLREGVIILDGADEYGMALVPKPPDPQRQAAAAAIRARRATRARPVSVATASIWDFLTSTGVITPDAPDSLGDAQPGACESMNQSSNVQPSSDAPASGDVSAMAFASRDRSTPVASTPIVVGPSLADFLGSASVADIDWTPDALPDLTNVDELVLNIESDGLDWTKGTLPISLSICSLDGQLRRFLPFRFAGGNLDEAQVKEWARRELRGKSILGANTRVDIHWMREWGIDLEEQGNTVGDVQLWAALLDDNRKQVRLDVLVKDYLKEEGPPRVDESRMTSYHASEVATRALYQTEAVARLRDEMWPLLDAERLHRVRQVEDDCIYPVVEMERNGAVLDLPLLDQMHADCKAMHAKLMLEVCDEAGFAFDVTAKGWQRLFERCGLKSGKSFNEAVVGVIDHPLIKKAHLAAQYASLDSKTFAAYKKLVGPDGVLHFEINQLRNDEGGTRSGRFSIGYVQQVPNHDEHHSKFGVGSPDDCDWQCPLFPRRLFIPGEGQVLEADAMQIEFRLLAHDANNPKVNETYANDPLTSFHKMMWGMLKVYKSDMLYGRTKEFNFAHQYGARSIKLGVMLGDITDEIAEEIRRTKSWNDPRLARVKEIEAIYKRVMPEGDQLLALYSHLAKPECDEFCRDDALHRKGVQHQGHVETLLGRRSRFPNGHKSYIGLNRRIQGSAADWMKMKIVEVHKERKHTGFLMRLTVHDQVFGDAREPDTKARVAEILNRQTLPLRIPILWDCGTGSNWAACE